jgi:Xaa-Pro aminopeptidase
MTDIFATRRQRVLERLGDTGVLVLAASPELTVGRDAELRYVVDSELYYLTGYTEPEAVMVLNGANAAAPYTLFVRPRDRARELWTGLRGGTDAAREQFGAHAAHSIADLAKEMPALLQSADTLYARTGSGRPELDAVLLRGLADARQRRPRTGMSPHTLSDPGELLDPMRLVKDNAEVELLREAARITAESFIEAIARIRDGVGEWEIEAALEYGFRARGAQGPAFPTIAAAGAHATVLHYTENSGVARNGDLLLLDGGARYAMYCGDVTRTVPVSGTFTTEQRDLYDIVIAAHTAALDQVRPGVGADAPQAAAQRVLAQGLIQLGLLSGTVEEAIEAETDGLKRYFPHRTSHWLGLDVHDVGAYATREGQVLLEPGMVLTIEPGLYDATRGIGIRIEDDVLVTAHGHEVLTDMVPR